ncbi:MAG: restriction endonuclease subunit S [Cyanobacteria bacterium REEB446]|nr:restriction endonuclease subunit S [Cyanobacteria bacterium REEB446]
MLATKPLDIRPDHAEIVHKILKDNLEEGTYVFAFGSRANWTAKQSSDLDLAMDGFGMKLDKKIKSNLEDAFEESDLPYKVDVVDLNSVSESFREAIQDQLVRVLWDWNEYSLDDVIKIIGGGTPKRSNPDYWNGEIPWLSVVDFNNDSKYVSKTSELITELGLKESSTKLLEKGQIIISARGTVGCLAQLKRKMAFNQSCYGIDGDTQYTTNDYLYYLLKEKISELKTKAHGAVFDTITKETFKTIYITLPPLPEQKRIAEILSSLDNKIEINKQISQTLEEMAEALFKSWFIDFDPVHVKKARLEAGAGEKEANLAVMKFISSKTDEELEKFQNDYPEKYRKLEDVAKLFPAEFQDGELGEVPLGWGIATVSDYLELAYGKALKQTDRSCGEYPVYGSGGVIGMHSDKLVSGPGIIIGRKGSIGKIYWSNKDFYPIDTTFFVVPKYSGQLEFLYHLMNCMNLESLNTDAAVPGLNRNNVHALKTLRFPLGLISYFMNCVRMLSNKHFSDESNSLLDLIKTLLPSMLSGDFIFVDNKTKDLLNG